MQTLLAVGSVIVLDAVAFEDDTLWLDLEAQKQGIGRLFDRDMIRKDDQWRVVDNSARTDCVTAVNLRSGVTQVLLDHEWGQVVA